MVLLWRENRFDPVDECGPDIFEVDMDRTVLFRYEDYRGMQHYGHRFVKFDYGVYMAHGYGVERGGGFYGVYDQLVAVDFDGGLDRHFLKQKWYIKFIRRRRPLSEFLVDGVYDFLLDHTFDRFKAQDKKRESLPGFTHVSIPEVI